MKFLLLVVLIWEFSPIQLRAQDNMEFEFFSFSELIKKREETGRSYYRFFDNESWSAGLYHLGEGLLDEQSPHELDEVYYVISGTGFLKINDKDYKVSKNKLFFVEKNVEHFFHGNTNELKVLYFFGGPDS